jgi:hypothetical protein
MLHIALMLASLNDLEVKSGDVLNAYITAPVKEKVWTVLDLKLDPTPARTPSSCALCMDLRVLEQCFAPTLPPLCARWVTPLAKPTLTFGTRLRLDPTTIIDTMRTYFATSMTFWLCTMTPCRYLIKSISTCL